jgi:hypothetical protein
MPDEPKGGWYDEWHTWHDANPPDMGNAAPHVSRPHASQPGDDLAPLVEHLRQVGERDQEAARKAATQRTAGLAATNDAEVAIRSESDETPVLEPHSESAPCDRCGREVRASYRGIGTRPNRLLCMVCTSHEFRFGETPLSTAEALTLYARSVRARLRRHR